MKRYILLLAFIVPLLAYAQSKNDSKYLAGAVPEINGAVVFSNTTEVTNRNKADIYDSLLVYVYSLMTDENTLPQSQIVMADKTKGLITLQQEEWLTFKKSALALDRAHMYYTLEFQCQDGSFTTTVKNIYYLNEAEEMTTTNTFIKAENWITDAEGLNKAKTKLARVSGKFRKGTIDRVEALYAGAAKAVGGKRKVKKVVEIEVEE